MDFLSKLKDLLPSFEFMLKFSKVLDIGSKHIRAMVEEMKDAFGE